jgi:hypothetical protein
VDEPILSRPVAWRRSAALHPLDETQTRLRVWFTPALLTVVAHPLRLRAALRRRPLRVAHALKITTPRSPRFISGLIVRSLSQASSSLTNRIALSTPELLGA